MRFSRRKSIPRGMQMTYGDRLCFPLQLIAIMDQTPLPFEHLCGKTYTCRGDKTVWAKSIRSGWSRRQAMLVLTIFADGVPYVKPDFLMEQTTLHSKATVERSASTTTHVLTCISIRGSAMRVSRPSMLRRNPCLPSPAVSAACRCQRRQPVGIRNAEPQPQAYQAFFLGSKI